MSETLALDGLPPVRRTSPSREEVTLPAPVPFSAPVLIGDAITPLGGETVLSLLWRRLDRPED